MKSAAAKRARRAWLAAPLAAALLAFFPAGAAASTVELFSFSSIAGISFTAGTGENNNVTVTRSGGQLTITDPGSTINSATCSVGGGGHTATCTTPPGAVMTFGNYDLGNGATDRLEIDFNGASDGSAFQNSVDGKGGNDTIVGSNGDADFDSLLGGTGDDTLNGRGGRDILTDFDFAEQNPPNQGGTNHLSGGSGDDYVAGGQNVDTVKGGPGDDEIDGGFGADRLNGGPGFDEADFRNLDFDPVSSNLTGIGVFANLPKRKATTRGPGAKQTDRLSSFEDVRGTDSADKIVGTRRINDLIGNAGRDLIIGGKAPDQLWGGDGRDLLKAKDGAVDRVSCGGNSGDRAKRDRNDKVSGC
jgi:Ca2+-binding RTX toxin-like protein